MPNINNERKYSVGFYTLGCKVNQYESENMAQAFEKEGFEIASANDFCDVYVINTCTVTGESERKAAQMIRRAISHNPDAYVLVCGCLSQQAPQKISTIKGVDFIAGSSNKMSIPQHALKLIREGKKNDSAVIEVDNVETAPFEEMALDSFRRTRAYVKIEDGCDSHCTYCIIPSVRGKVRSKPFEDCLNEVRAVTASGAAEIVLTGIETGSYGKDLDNVDLADLICAIDEIEGVKRIRLGSLDPRVFTREFVDRISSKVSVAPHFHVSVQHASDPILNKMKRKYSSKMMMDGILYLKEKMPNVQLSCDIIVGFPGETEEDFKTLFAFVKEVKFLGLHVFPYSKRAGTLAAEMQDQIQEPIKKQRLQKLKLLQAGINKQILDEQIESGRVLNVLFETFDHDFAYGHAENFVEVKVRSLKDLHGQILPVKPKMIDGKYLYGEIVN